MPKAASVRGLSQRKLLWSIPGDDPEDKKIVIHIREVPPNRAIGFRHLGNRIREPDRGVQFCVAG